MPKLPLRKSISSPLVSDGEKQTPDLSQMLSPGEDHPWILCCSNGDQEAPSQESSHLPPMEKSCCPSSRLLLNVLGTEAKHFPYPGPLVFHQQNETSNFGEKKQLTLKKAAHKKNLNYFSKLEINKWIIIPCRYREAALCWRSEFGRKIPIMPYFWGWFSSV